MKNKSILFLLFSLFLGILTACNSSLSESVTSPGLDTSKREKALVKNNILAMFIVIKDNIKNEFKEIIYPVALFINGSYVDVSNDVTDQIRNNFPASEVIRSMRHQTFLSAIKEFTLVNQNNKLGQFIVNQIAVNQFACTSLLTGQGTFKGQESLQNIFNMIPANHAAGFSGTINGKQVDETWRWTTAVSQYNPTQPTAISPTKSDETRYRQDLLTNAKSAISQSAKVRKFEGDFVVENLSVVDLDHDGKPEVFGIVRKGIDPDAKTDPLAAGTMVAYANVWLTYKSNQPQMISSQVSSYAPDSGKQDYNLLGTLDINGDGIEEVIVRNNGYESVSFGIYEYANNQLKQVFSGAGYGC